MSGSKTRHRDVEFGFQQSSSDDGSSTIFSLSDHDGVDPAWMTKFFRTPTGTISSSMNANKPITTDPRKEHERIISTNGSEKQKDSSSSLPVSSQKRFPPSNATTKNIHSGNFQSHNGERNGESSHDPQPKQRENHHRKNNTRRKPSVTAETKNHRSKSKADRRERIRENLERLRRNKEQEERRRRQQKRQKQRRRPSKPSDPPSQMDIKKKEPSEHVRGEIFPSSQSTKRRSRRTRKMDPPEVTNSKNDGRYSSKPPRPKLSTEEPNPMVSSSNDHFSYRASSQSTTNFRTKTKEIPQNRERRHHRRRSNRACRSSNPSIESSQKSALSRESHKVRTEKNHRSSSKSSKQSQSSQRYSVSSHKASTEGVLSSSKTTPLPINNTHSNRSYTTNTTPSIRTSGSQTKNIFRVNAYLKSTQQNLKQEYVEFVPKPKTSVANDRRNGSHRTPVSLSTNDDSVATIDSRENVHVMKPPSHQKPEKRDTKRELSSESTKLLSLSATTAGNSIPQKNWKAPLKLGEETSASNTVRVSTQAEIDTSAPKNVFAMWGSTVRAKKPSVNATLMSNRMINNQAEKIKERIAKAKREALVSGGGPAPSNEATNRNKTKGIQLDPNESVSALFHKAGAKSGKQRQSSISLENSAAALFAIAGKKNENYSSVDNSAAALFGAQRTMGETRESGTKSIQNSSVSMEPNSAPQKGNTLEKRNSITVQELDSSPARNDSSTSMDDSAAALFRLAGGDNDAEQKSINVLNLEDSIDMENSAAALFRAATKQSESQKSISMDNSAAALFGVGSKVQDTQNSISMDNSAAALFGVGTKVQDTQNSISMDNSAAALFGVGTKVQDTQNSISMDNSAAALFGVGTKVQHTQNSISMDNSAAALFGVGTKVQDTQNSISMDNSAAALFGVGTKVQHTQNSISMDNSAAALFLASAKQPELQNSISMDDSAAALFGVGTKVEDTQNSISMDNSAAALFLASAKQPELQKSISMDNSAAALFGVGPKVEDTQNSIAMDNSAAALFGVGTKNTETSNLISMNNSAAVLFGAASGDRHSFKQEHGNGSALRLVRSKKDNAFNNEDSTRGKVSNDERKDMNSSDRSSRSRKEREKRDGSAQKIGDKKEDMNLTRNKNKSNGDPKIPQEKGISTTQDTTQPNAPKKKSWLDDSSCESSSTNSEPLWMKSGSSKRAVPKVPTKSTGTSWLDNKVSELVKSNSDENSRSHEKSIAEKSETGPKTTKKSWLDDSSDSDSFSSASGPSSRWKKTSSTQATNAKKAIEKKSNVGSGQMPKNKSSLDHSLEMDGSSYSKQASLTKAASTLQRGQKKNQRKEELAGKENSPDANPRTKAKKSWLDDSSETDESSSDSEPMSPRKTTKPQAFVSQKKTVYRNGQFAAKKTNPNTTSKQKKSWLDDSSDSHTSSS